MKAKAWTLAIVLNAVAAYAATNDLTGLLQKGLFEEEANRDLSAAISNYQSLANAFDKDRQLAATAIFRLGECYRKLGKTNEAVVQYERIVREFGDQQTLATLSKQNLAGLGAAQRSRPSDTTDRTLAEAEASVEALKAQLEAIGKLNNEERNIFVQQNFPNPVLTKLMEDLNTAEQKLISIKKDYSADHPAYQNAKEQVDDLNRKINAQMEGVLRGLQGKLASAELQLNLQHRRQTELAQSTGGGGSGGQESVITDEEEKEIRRIQGMIQNSPDLINAPGGDPKMTPLYRAATSGWLRVAAYLLDHGAGVDIPSGGDTPLQGAARNANKGMIEFLLAHGADINAKSGRNGTTALHIAVEKGFSAVAQTLISHGADVAASTIYDRNLKPLHVAAANDRAELIRLLLANGADINAKDGTGYTPLQTALRQRNYDSVKALLAAKAEVNTIDIYGQTPLITAVFQNFPEAVTNLLAAKADPNAGTTNLPLSAAIEYSNTTANRSNFCAQLLQNGADPNKVAPVRLQNDGAGPANDFHQRYQNQIVNLSPIQLAVMRNDTSITKLLLDYKANARARGTSRATLLLEAADFSNDQMAGALIDHGADVNARGLDGETALHLAVSKGNRKLIELLLAHKADVNLPNKQGLTPLDFVKNWTASAAPGGLTINSGVILNGANSGVLTLNGASVTEPQPEWTPKDLADLLRQHGALDTLPNFSVIRVMREGIPGATVVFQQASNGWNQVTLLETIYNYYYDVHFSSVGGFPGSPSAAIQIRERSGTLPYPDLGRIIIHRPNRTSGGKDKEMPVNLLNGTNGVECALDVPLEFGDVVELPFREHALSDSEYGLGAEYTIGIRNCLQNHASILVRGHLVDLYPNRYLSFELQLPEARSALLSSSDLTRVKVTRKNPATGKSQEFLVDATRSAPQQDFWLHDGDVIEVPEKK